MMNMGFDGQVNGTCASAFAVHTNPTAWHQQPAPKGAIGLPPIHVTHCERWCDPSVHLPGASPSHCYASSCQKCDWCKGQPGNQPPPPAPGPMQPGLSVLAVHPPTAVERSNDLDDSFDGGLPQSGLPQSVSLNDRGAGATGTVSTTGKVDATDAGVTIAADVVAASSDAAAANAAGTTVQTPHLVAASSPSVLVHLLAVVGAASILAVVAVLALPATAVNRACRALRLQIVVGEAGAVDDPDDVPYYVRHHGAA